MLPALLIMVREGFEAALVIALVLAYLRKIDRMDKARSVWAGAGAAALLASAAGLVLHLTLGGLHGAARLRSFAVISLLAAGVLTWMIFWMRRESQAMKGVLAKQLDNALRGPGSTTTVTLVAFMAVLREGLEAALFLVAAATDVHGRDVVIGGALGLSIAACLGAATYFGTRRLPMRAFFQVTGAIVVVFAAGLVARSVFFLQVAHDLGTLDGAVYDLTSYRWLTPSTELGKFLGAMFGWDAKPSLEQIGCWVAYLLPVTWFFFRPTPASNHDAVS